MRALITLLFVALAQADEVPKLWPTGPFKHVVAYCYDYSQDQRGAAISFPDGSLHRGVIRATTIRLTDAQAQKLRRLLSEDADGRGDVNDYDPHHAFVFYDADWKVTASIDICFQCDDYAERPKGVSESINVAALEAFCRELGLPIFEDSSDYTKLFSQEQPSEKPSAPAKKIPVVGADDPFAEDE